MSRNLERKRGGLGMEVKEDGDGDVLAAGWNIIPNLWVRIFMVFFLPYVCRAVALNHLWF